MAKVRADRQGQFRTAYDKNRQRILASASVCGICGKPLVPEAKSPDPLATEVDHIVPLNRGGHPSDISNLQAVHRWCNRQKSDKLFDTQGIFKQDNQTVEASDLPLHTDWGNLVTTEI